MSKRTRKLISLLLVLTLVFCTASIFVGSASAEVNRNGTRATETKTLSGVTMTGTVSRTTTSATATTRLTQSGGLYAHVLVDFVTPASPNLTASENKLSQNVGTSVSATITLNSLYTTKRAYGGHDVNYGDLSFGHLNTAT